MAIANGPPWVVPSLDSRVLPPINRVTSFLYVLINTFPKEGHKWRTCLRAISQFNELKAFEASTNRSPSVLWSRYTFLIQWMTNWYLELWPAQRCKQQATFRIWLNHWKNCYSHYKTTHFSFCYVTNLRILIKSNQMTSNKCWDSYWVYVIMLNIIPLQVKQ